MTDLHHQIILPRKLIETALPLDAINAAAAREKALRHGNPSTLHIWWARRPLASARAVLFAQMVNDPADPLISGKNGEDAKVQAERARLFGIINKLVLYENINNLEVIREARDEIMKSWRVVCRLNQAHPQAATLFNPEQLPPFHDPFAGGGALPLEAQRLGLKSHASDLNPVAVIINKAMIEIPPRFRRGAPVGPATKGQADMADLGRPGASALAEDVRRYGAWVYQQALEKIGDLYPPVTVNDELLKPYPHLKKGDSLPVVAWLWARTVASPDPRYAHAHTPLVSNFKLSKNAWVEPVIAGDAYSFIVRYGTPPPHAAKGTKSGMRSVRFRCLFSGATITGEYIKAEGVAGRMRSRLMAIVADGGRRGRVYLSPQEEHEKAASSAKPDWKPYALSPVKLTGGTCSIYGLTTWGDYFTDRQLVGLNTLSAIIEQAAEKCRQDAVAAGMEDDGVSLDKGGAGATAYGQAIGFYLALRLSHLADRNNVLCTWKSGTAEVVNLFARQAMAMAWDFAENNPLGKASGGFQRNLKGLIKVLNNFSPAPHAGYAAQADAQAAGAPAGLPPANKIIVTDPPYYDNIAYADISDFFYVWLKKNLRDIYPALFATIQTPKDDELVALSYRHESKAKAAAFFMNGMAQVMRRLRAQTHPAFPAAIYYAFKQSRTKDGKTYNTGWASFLQALMEAGFCITATLPMRTELSSRPVGSGANALASSIVLVCRQRAEDAKSITRREFIQRLNAELPHRLRDMHAASLHSDIAPVDMSQIVIGPGMEIFSRYAAVLDARGKAMEVEEALALINSYVGDNDFDAISSFCLDWFAQYNWAPGDYGGAETMATAKNTGIVDMKAENVLTASKGKVQLCRAHQYPALSAETPRRVSLWQGLHYIAAVLDKDGHGAAGRKLADLTLDQQGVKQLAYRLYAICEQKKWSDDARLYDQAVRRWNDIQLAERAEQRRRKAAPVKELELGE